MKRVSLFFICALLSLSSSFAAESVTLNPIERPILILTDFTHAKVSTDHGKVVLLLTLTDDGTRKLGAFSADHVGEKLAVLIGGQVVASPEIRTPISGNGLSIDALSKPEAVRLAQAINSQRRK